jgi:hypothetical protein
VKFALAVLIAIYSMPLASASAATGDRAAFYVAKQTWGEPDCGQPRLEVSTPAEYVRAHGTGEFDSEPEAWADEDRCVIVLNPQLTIRTAVRRCHIIVHEWGHLAGREHSQNPRSVMFGEDDVTESRLQVKRRWVWEASGAFRPCYAATQPGASFG